MVKFFLIFLSLINFSKNSMANDNNKYETAIIAGGCFWGVENLFSKFVGVTNTEVGYIGSNYKDPTYDVVKLGLSGHAESVKIIFDPNKTSYEKILKFFFKIHDPTQLNKQQNDIGTQYRSEIFYLNEKQKEVAENLIKKLDQSGVFKNKIVTKLSKAGIFYVAEEYHQNYLKKNPNGYNCHYIRKDLEF